MYKKMVYENVMNCEEDRKTLDCVCTLRKQVILSCSSRMHSSRFNPDILHTKLKLMKKNTKNIQMPIPEKTGVCATCFFKFHDRTSNTGFYCIRNHEEVLANGSC